MSVNNAVAISLIFLLGWFIRFAFRRVNKPKIDQIKNDIAALPDSDSDEEARLRAEVAYLEAQGRPKGYRYVLACLSEERSRWVVGCLFVGSAHRFQIQRWGAGGSRRTVAGR